MADTGPHLPAAATVGGADAAAGVSGVTEEEIADFTAGLKSLGIDTTTWKAVAQARLASGVNKLVDVIPDDETRAAFVKFTSAVKQNVDNRHTVLQKLQNDNPEVVGRLKGFMARVAENVDLTQLKATTGKWLASNQEELSGLKEDLVGLYKDVAGSEEFAALKEKGLGVAKKIQDTEQATQLVERGKELLASEKAKQLLDASAQQASALSTAEGDSSVDIDGRLQKVMKSKVVQKAMEHGSKLLESEQVQEALAKGTTYMSVNGGTKVTEAIQKGRAVIQQTRNSRATQKLLHHSAAFLDKHGDAILDRLEGTDVDSVIAKGRGVFTDPVERQKFINQVKDMAMEFLIKQLPSVQIPPIEGIADRLQFGIDNLDLSSFVIRKEDVHMKLGNFLRTGNLFEVTVANVCASMQDFNWLFHQHYFPNLHGTGSANADIQDGTVRLNFGLRRVEDEAVRGGFLPRLVVNNLEIEIGSLELKFFDSKMSGIINLLSRLFKDTIRRRLTETLALQTASQLGRLVGTLNTFATKYMPMILEYFQVDMSHLPEGTPGTNVVGMDEDPEYGVFFITDGPLGFSLRLLKESPDLPTRAVVLKSSNPRIKEAHYLVAWQGARDRRRKNAVIDETLTAEKQLLKLVQEIKKTKRPITLFFRTDDVGGDDGAGPGGAAGGEYVSTPSEFDVTFGEGPLGILIHKRQDVDQGAVVSGFKRGEDGSLGAAEAQGMIAPGQILIAINGKSTLSKNFKKTIKEFVKAPRPITLTLRKHPDFTVVVREKPSDRIAFEPLATRLASLDGMVLVTGFEQLPGQAQQSGMLRSGMYVKSVAGEPVHDGNLAALIKASPRPVTMSLHDPVADEDVVVTFEKGPIGLLFKKGVDSRGHVVVNGFVKSRGPVERTGQVLVGHVLTHVEGKPVGDSVELAAQLIQEALETSGSGGGGAAAAAAGGKDRRKVSLTFRDMDLYMELYPTSGVKSPRKSNTAAVAAGATPPGP